MVVATALPQLEPSLAVYVDVPFQQLDPGGEPRNSAALMAAFQQSKSGRTAARLAHTRPWWKPCDREVEEEAARLFDVPTAVALELATDGAAIAPPSVEIPSLLIHADPSAFVSVERTQELRSLGFAVRGVRGAGHSVWYGFFHEFMHALDDWLMSQPTR
jgi:hypothetical protein